MSARRRDQNQTVRPYFWKSQDLRQMCNRMFLCRIYPDRVGRNQKPLALPLRAFLQRINVHWTVLHVSAAPIIRVFFRSDFASQGEEAFGTDLQFAYQETSFFVWSAGAYGTLACSLRASALFSRLTACALFPLRASFHSFFVDTTRMIQIGSETFVCSCHTGYSARFSRDALLSLHCVIS